MKKIFCLSIMFLFIFVGHAWAPPPIPLVIGGKPVKQTTAPTDGQSLIYNATTGKWEPGAPTGAGLGDVSSDTALSVDAEVVLFKSITGKLVKRATLTGLPYLTSGVLGTSKVTLTQPATGSTLTILDGKTLTINKSITFTSADDTSVITVPIGAHTLAPTDSPTFTGTVTLPAAPFTVGATAVTTTGAQFNYLNAATGTTGTTSTNLVFSTSPTLVTPTLGDASATTINKVTITAPAAGSTLTILNGKTLTVNNTLTLAAGDETSTLTVPAGGGTLGTAAFTAATAYQAADVDLDSLAGGLTGPIKGLGNGNGYSAAAAADIVGLWTACSGYLKSDGTCDNPSGAGDVTSVGDCLSGACLDGTSDGGSYVELYAVAGNTRLVDTAGTLEVKTAAGAAYAPLKVLDLTATGTTTLNTGLTGILKATAGVVAAATAGTDYPGLASNNTWTGGSNSWGDADTDVFIVRSMIYGGNSREVQINAGARTTPTYPSATPTEDLYVKGNIETPLKVYAQSFESVPPVGNPGYLRLKEDPANGTNYREFTVVSALTTNLQYEFPDTTPTANNLWVLGATSGGKSTVAHQTLTALIDAAIGSTQGNILYRGASNWAVLAPGTSGWVLTTKGAAANPEWNAVTAAADTTGGAGAVQFNNAGALLSKATFVFTAASDTLTVTNFSGATTTQAAGDNSTKLASTAYADALVSDTAYDGTSWNGVTGIAPSKNAVRDKIELLAPIDSPTFTTFVKIPSAASPTTDAAGKIAIRTGADAASAIQFYGNASPGSVAIPTYQIGWPVVIANPTATSDYPFLYTPYAITLRALHIVCSGSTSWTGQLVICDANYGTCSTNTQAADNTVTCGTATNVTTFSDATIASGVWVQLKTTSVVGSPTQVAVQAEYTVD